MELFWALYYFFWLKVLISIDVKKQTFTVAELSPGPALCRMTLTAGKWQCAPRILRNDPASGLAWFASWCALVPHAFCFWEGISKPCSDGRLLRIPRCQLLGAPLVPSLMSLIHTTTIWQQTKPFAERLNDKKDDLGEQPNCHVGPHLCGNLWKCFTYMDKNYSVMCSSLKF